MKEGIKTEAFNLLTQDEMIAVDGGVGLAAGVVIGIVAGWLVNAVCIGFSGTTPDQELGKAIRNIFNPGEVHGRLSTGGGGHY